MSLDRRRSFRTALTTKVRLRHRDEPTRILSTNDLGPRGVFLRSSTPVAQDETVALEIVLPGESVPLEVEGRVVWLEPGRGDHPAGMGVRFTRVRNTDADRLNRFFSVHHSLAGSRVVVLTDEPFEARDLVRSLAREGLEPQVAKWSDDRPEATVPTSAYVVIPSQPGQAARFTGLRSARDIVRPGILAILTHQELASEWGPVASMCLHGMPEPDRAAALALCIATPAGGHSLKRQLL
jgi:uncharacterized protein (TIGR02266 family)